MFHGSAPNAQKPNGYIWERVSGHVASKSLEWIHLEKRLNLEELNTKNGAGGLAENAHNRQRWQSKDCQRIRPNISRPEFLPIGKSTIFLKDFEN